jgi:hypothetical protein
MGPCVIGGGDGPPAPTTAARRTLVWRLGLTGITGPATATVHLGSQGAASPILTTLCTGCRSDVKGKLKLTAVQAQQLLKGNATVDVQAGSGELAGKVTVRRSTR